MARTLPGLETLSDADQQFVRSQAKQPAAKRVGNAETNASVWLVEKATIRPWDGGYQERYGTATFTLQAADGDRLVLVRCSLKAAIADAKVVDKLSEKRKQVQATISEDNLAGSVLKGRAPLSAEDRQPLTGAYRMFTMDDLQLVGSDGRKYPPLWCASPMAKVTLYGLNGFLSGSQTAAAEPVGWGGTLKTGRVFVGVLEVGKATELGLLYSLPKAVKLDGRTLAIAGGKSATVEVAKE